MLGWLSDQGATGSSARSTIWDSFREDPRGFYYGDPFSLDEQDDAAGWLLRNELINGITAAGAVGPLRSYVTDRGERCVERFDADVRAYTDEMERPSNSNVTWNVTGRASPDRDW